MPTTQKPRPPTKPLGGDAAMRWLKSEQDGGSKKKPAAKKTAAKKTAAKKTAAKKK
jgi:topoisomerase IA-like protein